MRQLKTFLRKLGSSIVGGLGLVVVALLIPWILTAALVWLFPRFSYGLVERWVCPEGASIDVEGTSGMISAVLTDADNIKFPQVTCVDAREAVVLRGKADTNLLAYSRVYGVVVVGFYGIAFAVYAILWLTARLRRSLRLRDGPL